MGKRGSNLKTLNISRTGLVPLIAANSRARASTISEVTVPIPAAFSIMIPLFSGFFLIINQPPIRVYLELRDEHSGEPRRERRSRFYRSCPHQIQHQFS